MPEYFRKPAIIWWILIPLGLALCFTAYINPALIDTPLILWKIGPFAASIGRNYSTVVLLISIAAIAAHVFEAGVAFGICCALKFSWSISMQWTIQTFLLGGPSLTLLFKHSQRKSDYSDCFKILKSD